MLCLPLMRQEKLSGVLYLENNLATNAFSPARLSLLGHIASQAAISIENARLYADVQKARQELEAALAAKADESEALPPLDVTAPMVPALIARAPVAGAPAAVRECLRTGPQPLAPLARRPPDGPTGSMR